MVQPPTAQLYRRPISEAVCFWTFSRVCCARCGLNKREGNDGLKPNKQTQVCWNAQACFAAARPLKFLPLVLFRQDRQRGHLALGTGFGNHGVEVFEDLLNRHGVNFTP